MSNIYLKIIVNERESLSNFYVFREFTTLFLGTRCFIKFIHVSLRAFTLIYTRAIMVGII